MKRIIIFLLIILTNIGYGQVFRDNYSRLSQIASIPPVINPVYTNDLVAYWALRTDFQDFSENNTDLECATCPVKRNGIYGQSFYFIDNDNTTFSDSNITTQDNPRAVSFWYKPITDTPSVIFTIGDINISQGNFTIQQFKDDDNDLYIEAETTVEVIPGLNIPLVDRPEQTINLNEWVFFTISYSSFGTNTFYFNGIESAIIPEINNFPSEGDLEITQTGIGTIGLSTNSNFLISDVALWNRSLSSNEIYSLYTNRGSLFIK